VAARFGSIAITIASTMAIHIFTDVDTRDSTSQRATTRLLVNAVSGIRIGPPVSSRHR
jgi:hypothetical protein